MACEDFPLQHTVQRLHDILVTLVAFDSAANHFLANW